MDTGIIKDYIKAIEATHFQSFCDRLLLRIYPDDYTPTRAGGSHGDMKNDGYCPKARIFFAAHASRGESASKIKKKVKSDLEGCLEKQNNILKFIYLTNDTLIGEVEKFIDDLGFTHTGITIETWGPDRLFEKIKDFPEKDIEFIIERKIPIIATVTYNKHLTSLPLNFDPSKEAIGRKKELEKIQRLMEIQNKALLLNGLGGIGKTTLARYYLHQNQNSFAHIIWINALNGIKEAFVSNTVLILKQALGP